MRPTRPAVHTALWWKVSTPGSTYRAVPTTGRALPDRRRQPHSAYEYAVPVPYFALSKDLDIIELLRLFGKHKNYVPVPEYRYHNYTELWVRATGTAWEKEQCVHLEIPSVQRVQRIRMRIYGARTYHKHSHISRRFYKRNSFFFYRMVQTLGYHFRDHCMNLYVQCPLEDSISAIFSMVPQNSV